MIDGKPITDVLGEIENGQLLTDLTRELYKVVHAVMETRKAGDVTLKLKLTPTGRGSVEIDATYTSKAPEHDRPTTTFFTTNDGTLVRNDPSQPRLPLREVETPANIPIRVTD